MNGEREHVKHGGIRKKKTAQGTCTVVIVGAAPVKYTHLQCTHTHCTCDMA